MLGLADALMVFLQPCLMLRPCVIFIINSCYWLERVGKSLPMVVGSEEPTIIQPPLYKARFTNAMERYFMTVPSKWTSI